MKTTHRIAALSFLILAAATAASAQTAHPWSADRASKLSQVLGGDDMSAKGEALGGLFDAARSRKPEPGAVSAGSWGAPASGLESAKAGSPRAGAAGVTVPAPWYPGKAEKKDVVLASDLGDKLRDRNDKKLADGTKQQKDAEKAWKDYKKGDSVSPRPPVANEISIGGKG
jgi:hypothetical protein